MSLFDRIRNNSSDSRDQELWNEIPGEGLETLLRYSEEKPQLIYKYSDRCSVCFMAKQELENVAEKISDIADVYMINVVQQRDVSNAIASELNIRHESPQVLILKDGEVNWCGSHWQIKGNKILSNLS